MAWRGDETMRAGLLIVAVILAGLALAWALSTPPYLPSNPAAAPSESVRAENGRVTLAPTSEPAPSIPVAETKPVEAGVDANPVNVNPVDAKPGNVNPAATKSIDPTPAASNPNDATPADAPAGVNPVEPEENDASAATDAPKTEPDAPAPDDSAGETADADSPSTETGEDAGSTEGESSASGEPIDPGHAADLLADWMAREDAASADAGAEPSGAETLSTFDHEEADPEWSEATAQQIEATLRAWLDALPENIRAHMALIHVECRQTLCQILAADADGASQAERAQASQEWQQAIATLPQQPWWASFGFVDLQTAVNTDPASGYVLYQAYLRREVKPAG
jgi:hypothetical protein